MRKMLSVFMIVSTFLVLSHLYVLQHDLVIPVKIVMKQTTTAAQLRSIGVNSNIAPSVEMVSKQTGLSPELLIALMYTESTGNAKAVSSKGYKGLMQIPFAVYYTDANLLIGAHIFNEKMKQTNRNLIHALCLYKGYPIDSERGIMQAKKVIALKNKLQMIGES